MVERGCSTPNMDSHIYALKNFYDMNDIEDIRTGQKKEYLLSCNHDKSRE